MSGTYTLNGGWELMQDLHDMAGASPVEITTEDVAQLLGIERPAASSLIYDMRMRGLLDSGAPLNSRRKITQLGLTPLGLRVFEAYVHKGEKAAEAMIPERAGQAKRQPKPEAPVSDRAQALREARELLGPDASVDDLLRVAEFVAG